MLFKDRLKHLRKEKELTQDDLAQTLGYTRSAISGYELGRNEPSNEDLKKLAIYFDVDLAYLLGASDIRKKDLPKEKVNINENVDILYTKLSSMKETTVVLIGEIAESVDKGLLNADLLKQLLKLANRNGD